MENITDIISNYKECRMMVWNNYFSVDSTQKRDFIFETDKAFSLVDTGLFNALVIAKTCDHQLPNTKVYESFLVKPKHQLTALYAKDINNTFEWKEVQIDIETGTFNFMELFDWDFQGAMNCEFVRARLTASESIPKMIGCDFLFDYNAVEIYKL